MEKRGRMEGNMGQAREEDEGKEGRKNRGLRDGGILFKEERR